jgi:hypothetical protein
MTEDASSSSLALAATNHIQELMEMTDAKQHPSSDRNPLIQSPTTRQKRQSEVSRVESLLKPDMTPHARFHTYYQISHAPSKAVQQHWTRDIRQKRHRCTAIAALVLVFGALLFGALVDNGVIFPKPPSQTIITTLGPLMDRLPSQFALYFRAQTSDGQTYSGRAFVRDRTIQLLYVTYAMQGRVLALVTDNSTTEAQTFYVRAHDKEEPAESVLRWPIAWLPEQPTTHWNLWQTLSELPLISSSPPSSRNRTTICQQMIQGGGGGGGEQQWVHGPDGVDVWHICFGRYNEPRFVTGRRLFIEFHGYVDLAPDGPDYALVHRIEHPGWIWNTDVVPNELLSGSTIQNTSILNRLQTVVRTLLPVAWSVPNRLAQLAANASSVAPANAGQKLLFGLHPRQTIAFVPPETRKLDHGALCMFVPGAGVRGTMQSGSTAQFAHFAYGHNNNNGDGGFPQHASVSPTEPWHAYWGNWILDAFEDERGVRYGCAETWVFVGDDEDRAFDDPELVTHICGQANDLLQRSTTSKQPLALFAHGSGGLTLLQGIRDGRCRSELTFFAASVPIGGSGDGGGGTASVLQWLCDRSADATLNTWPLGEFFSIRQLTGTCKQLRQGTLAARPFNLTWPAFAPLARQHIRGALCGASGMGRARAVDAPGSFALGLLEQIRRIGFGQVTKGDGLVTIHSCMGQFDDQDWQADPKMPFYLGELNYLDTTCAHGDSPTLPAAQPCAWYRHRIQSVFNATRH